MSKINEHNINFVMNNVLLNKGIKNHKLINFCISNNLNIYTPTHFKYHAYGKENSRQLEVCICKYTPKNNDHDFKQIEIHKDLF